MEPPTRFLRIFFKKKIDRGYRTAGVFLHHSHSRSQTALRSDQLNGPRGRRVPCASWNT